MARCEFFYDFSSPFAYLGATQMQRVCEGHELVWRPFFLGGLFKTIGTPPVPLATFPEAKARLVMFDQYRWADHWGVDFKFPSRFPQLTVKPLRVVLQVPEDKIGPLSLAFFDVMWVNDGDLTDEATLGQVIEAQGLDADALLAGTRDPAVKARLLDNTDEAARRGVVGAPTSIVNDMVFWGQDRLDFVRRALDGWQPRLPEADLTL